MKHRYRAFVCLALIFSCRTSSGARSNEYWDWLKSKYEEPGGEIHSVITLRTFLGVRGARTLVWLGHPEANNLVRRLAHDAGYARARLRSGLDTVDYVGDVDPRRTPVLVVFVDVPGPDDPPEAPIVLGQRLERVADRLRTEARGRKTLFVVGRPIRYGRGQSEKWFVAQPGDLGQPWLQNRAKLFTEAGWSEFRKHLGGGAATERLAHGLRIFLHAPGDLRIGVVHVDDADRADAFTTAFDRTFPHEQVVPYMVLAKQTITRRNVAPEDHDRTLEAIKPLVRPGRPVKLMVVTTEPLDVSPGYAARTQVMRCVDLLRYPVPGAAALR